MMVDLDKSKSDKAFGTTHKTIQIKSFWAIQDICERVCKDNIPNGDAIKKETTFQ
jgi:hypothetical protein